MFYLEISKKKIKLQNKKAKFEKIMKFFIVHLK